MKKIRITTLVAFLFTVTIFIGIIGNCKAEGQIIVPRIEKDKFVYDEANMIDDQIEKQTNSLLVQLEKKTGVEFAVITVQSLQDMTIEDYANDLFNTLGIGKKDKNNGILLLISKNDTKVRLEIGLGLEDIINDAKCGRILDNYFVPYRQKNQYSKATEETVKATMSVLGKEYKVTFDSVKQEDYDITEKGMIGGLIMLIIAIIIIVGGIKIFVDLFSNDDDDYPGSSSGGSGFPRGSSGGSFGGGFSRGSSGGSFGGGFSGGGGASR